MGWKLSPSISATLPLHFVNLVVCHIASYHSA